jgi:titin
LTNIHTIGQRWCGSGCTDWESNVRRFYAEQVGNPDTNDLSFNGNSGGGGSSCPTVSGQVELYDLINCGGDSTVANGTGLWTMETSFNDRAESIAIPSGWSVTLYKDNSTSSPSVCIPSTANDLRNYNYSDGTTAANSATWLYVYDQSNCPSSSPPSTPSNLRVSGTTQTSITIAWDDTSNETGYKIYKWDWVSSFVYFDSVGANITSYTDNTLTCGSDAYYEVSAYNNAGESGQTGWVMGTTSACPSNPPSTPSSPNPSDGATLERTSDTTLYWSTDGTSCDIHIWGGNIDITPSGGCSSLHLGSQYGGSYQWQVTAHNSSGTTTGPTWHFNIKSYSPTNLSALAASASQINLSWTKSSDDPGSVDSYYIYYSNGTYIGSAAAGATNYQVSNLTCNTSYSFYVTAYRQGVVSNASNTAGDVTSACGSSIPNTPSNLRVSGATQTSITIAWDDTSNETGYKIYKWDWVSSFVYFDSVGANITSYTDNTLTCGSDAYYEVSAYNDAGESGRTGWVMGTTSICPSYSHWLYLPFISK